ncbi:hypothetical protein NDU88_001697 [Pleurodeles waltl]|uniref:Uncharacterized protein n=1 Tax=Pleurodeles waltl TaxID=8319 RepID=A0AAV7P696_PLEWA|nr:hypothetical protein NDU88_001697 [Pleurodeles waltl]
MVLSPKVASITSSPKAGPVMGCAEDADHGAQLPWSQMRVLGCFTRDSAPSAQSSGDGAVGVLPHWGDSASARSSEVCTVATVQRLEPGFSASARSCDEDTASTVQYWGPSLHTLNPVLGRGCCGPRSPSSAGSADGTVVSFSSLLPGSSAPDVVPRSRLPLLVRTSDAVPPAPQVTGVDHWTVPLSAALFAGPWRACCAPNLPRCPSSSAS